VLKPQIERKTEQNEDTLSTKQAELEKQQRRRARLESKLKKLEKKVNQLQTNEEEDDFEEETKIAQLNELISEELEKQEKLKVRHA
jgi:hypothetical protein